MLLERAFKRDESKSSSTLNGRYILTDMQKRKSSFWRSQEAINHTGSWRINGFVWMKSATERLAPVLTWGLAS